MSVFLRIHNCRVVSTKYSLVIDNTKNAPQSVEIEECDSAQCSLDPEKKYNTAVRFVTPSSSKAAYFTDGHSACSNMSSCPFTAGEYVVYKGVLTGESLGHFELIDDARDSVVCFTI